MVLVKALDAIYVQTGKRYSAAAITKDSPLKPGPWRCVVDGCAVPLHHRMGGSRATPSGGTTEVAPFFFCTEKNGHDGRYVHPRPVRTTANASIPSTSKKSIHRLTGFPTAPVNPSLPAPGARPTPGAPSELGDPLSGIGGLLAWGESIAAGEIPADDKIRFDGADYFWHDLRYECTHADFARIENELASQVGSRRAYFIRGTVKYQPYPSYDGLEWLLRLICPAGPGGQRVEIRCFLPRTPEFDALRDTLRADQVVDVFARKYLPVRINGLNDVKLTVIDEIRVLT